MAGTIQKKEIVGIGFSPKQARHGFLVHVPKGTSKGDMIQILEFRDYNAVYSHTFDDGPPAAAVGRVIIDRGRWLELAPSYWAEANRRLRSNGLPTCKFQKNPSKPIFIHPSLGKELVILCWAVEESPSDNIPNALQNWEALAPEERWWLFTMTVATTGRAAEHRGLGWRKALRAALADNPFIKGEGMSPKARRELLGHSQLTLEL